MTDKTKLIALAYDMGTLKRVTKKYTYISSLRYEFDQKGNIERVCRQPPHGKSTTWKEL